MRLLALLLVLVPAAAEESWNGLRGREAEDAILARWSVAGPSERRRMRAVLDAVDERRRFVDAGPLVIPMRERTYTLAELFTEILEPALEYEPEYDDAGGLGMTIEHRNALVALAALREALAPPRSVNTGTLNLLLDYAHKVLTAELWSPGIRLRMFAEVVRNARGLDGRAEPDARTRWLIRDHLMPALMATARQVRRDSALTDLVSQAASLLFLPSILDDGAQMQLAPLVRGTHTADVLLRAYRRGRLDKDGLAALSQSVAGQARDDAAFMAGSPPLLLELLCDPELPAKSSLALVDVVLERLTGVAPLRGTVIDLLACGFGGAARDLDAYQKSRASVEGGLEPPSDGRRFRFLRVVLIRTARDRPPRVAEVVRADARLHEPIRADDGRGGSRFLGVLLPSKSELDADFVGPPPGLTKRQDRRLLRRTLRLERIAVGSFGAHADEIELCVALPEDASEPVPARGASLVHVLDLVRARLDRTLDDGERLDLVRLLVRIGSREAHSLAVRHARGSAVTAIVPLAERGVPEAREAILPQIHRLDYRDRVRVLAAILATGDDESRKTVRDLCARAPVGTATVAADQLLSLSGDAAGVVALLGRKEPYARLCGTSLTLRMSPLAGGIRIVTHAGPSFDTARDRARTAFKKGPDGFSWVRYGDWLKMAFGKPKKMREHRRGGYRKQFLIPTVSGSRNVEPKEFVEYYERKIDADEIPDKLMTQLAVWLLSPWDPGRGLDMRNLKRIFRALRAKAGRHPGLHRALADNLTILASAQAGIEMQPEYLDFAHDELTRLAGFTVPPEAKRQAGVFWPIWAAHAAQEGSR